MNILIVDDDSEVRRALRLLLLREPGWKVIGEAADGLDGVEQALRLKPDLILMDVSMPGIDGIEATRRIAQALPETPVLVISQHDSPHMAELAKQAGACSYVVKSQAQHLIAAVKVGSLTPSHTGAHSKQVHS